MDLCNIQIVENEWVVHSSDYDSFKSFTGPKKIIHWLVNDEEQISSCKIYHSDSQVKGLIELHAKNYVGKTVQLERYGFGRIQLPKQSIQTKDVDIELWFGHK